jgi:lipid-binding SYLF domain-containing protein
MVENNAMTGALAFTAKRNFFKNLGSVLRNLLIVVATVAAFSLSVISGQANATPVEDLKKDAAQALQTLYKRNPVAETISKKAKEVLVFPNVIKAGLIFGGSYGEGVMMKDSNVEGYYNTVSASWGWQAGAQSYAYVVFLMNDKAKKHLEKSDGWSIGVGPTVVVVDAGIAKNLTSTTLRDDAYAFIFDQQGLMASLSIEGTKITRIKKP